METPPTTGPTIKHTPQTELILVATNERNLKLHYGWGQAYRRVSSDIILAPNGAKKIYFLVNHLLHGGSYLPDRNEWTIEFDNVLKVLSDEGEELTLFFEMPRLKANQQTPHSAEMELEGTDAPIPAPQAEPPGPSGTDMRRQLKRRTTLDGEMERLEAKSTLKQERRTEFKRLLKYHYNYGGPPMAFMKYVNTGDPRYFITTPEPLQIVQQPEDTLKINHKTVGYLYRFIVTGRGKGGIYRPISLANQTFPQEWLDCPDDDNWQLIKTPLSHYLRNKILGFLKA